MRYTLQSPPMCCYDIARVKQFVESTPVSQMLLADYPMAAPTHKRLTIIQRLPKEGRSIENMDEVLQTVEENFRDSVDVRVVTSLGQGIRWTAQFRIFSITDILVAVGGGALGWIWAMPTGGVAIELRYKGSPVWLPCSERWNHDVKEMFGGLANVVAVHHICIRPHVGSVQAWRDSEMVHHQLSDPKKMTEYD